MLHRALVATFALFCLLSSSHGEYLNTKHFPEGFKMGVATAAYQIEGAYIEDGKSENIWDTLTHNRSELISDGSNGDVACDSYHKVEEDVALIKDLGVDFYRFSISWARVLPKGYSYYVNPAGIDYYNKLIDALIKEGITPMVTLYHWDLPQVLQDAGGWPNELLADYFADYARVMFENFGDRVKWWLTFNEPFNTCHQGYGNVLKAPALNMTGYADYLCTHTVLKAHAKVYHMYDEEYRSKQKGSISITLDTAWFEPASNSSEDEAAAERMRQFTLGWYAHPIFTCEGDYPKVMKELIANRSALEGYSESRLPSFTEDEIKYIKGTYDFFGLNVYTTKYATPETYDIADSPHWTYDTNARVFYDENWETAASEWLAVVPWGFRKLLNWVKANYGDVEIYITENGYSDLGELEDVDRIVYLELYMSAMLDAIYTDRVNVKGYTIWSLLDNFEWLEGYTHFFGLYKVNFTDPERTRTPKTSVRIIKEIIANWQLPSKTYDETDDDSGAQILHFSLLTFVSVLLCVASML